MAAGIVLNGECLSVAFDILAESWMHHQAQRICGTLSQVVASLKSGSYLRLERPYERES
jgi:hypothetical protein